MLRRPTLAAQGCDLSRPEAFGATWTELAGQITSLGYVDSNRTSRSNAWVIPTRFHLDSDQVMGRNPGRSGSRSLDKLRLRRCLLCGNGGHSSSGRRFQRRRQHRDGSRVEEQSGCEGDKSNCQRENAYNGNQPEGSPGNAFHEQDDGPDPDQETAVPGELTHFVYPFPLPTHTLRGAPAANSTMRLAPRNRK
jgi:hypothetical protein